MWRKGFSWQTVFFMIGALLVVTGGYFTAPAGFAQNLAPSRMSYDPTTERDLQQLDRLLIRGTPEEIIELIQQIVRASGYIPELAKAYYELARHETDGDTLVNYYIAIIDYWPQSAWAQKSVIEVVPLIIMSGGEWGKKNEPLIWKQQAHLLTPSKDAPSLGEVPEELQADVFIQLLHLAHFRVGDVPRVKDLLAQVPSRASLFQDQIDLARAYAMARSGNRPQARAAFLQFLDKYTDSTFRPLAALALFDVSEDEKQMDEALRIVELYDGTLESMWLHWKLGQKR